MKLTNITFMNGMKILACTYAYWKVNISDPQVMGVWSRHFRHTTDEEAFLPLIEAYCQTEPEPKSPADIMNYARNMMIDSTLSPENFVQAFINAIEQMREDDFVYGDPSIEEQKDYVLWNIFARYPECRIDFVHGVVKGMVQEYFNSLYEAVRCGNTTTLSIVSSEIKSKYVERLRSSACRTTFTLDTIKQLESKVSRNRELPQGNKFMEIEGGTEWN